MSDFRFQPWPGTIAITTLLEFCSWLFIKSVFEGKNLIRDIEEIRESIQENYFGASAKTVVMAARSARMKLLDCLENRKNEHQ